MNDTTTQLTEADVMAYFATVLAEYAPQFPDVRDMTISSSSGHVGFFGYIDDDFNHVCGHANTFAEAAVKLRAKLGTKETKAAKLRKQANALLAEAEKLAAAT